MTNDIEPRKPDDDDPGTAVCPKCLAEIPPAVDFCSNCRAPVTSFANTGYLESALAEGWGIGESVVTKAPTLVTLIGLWLLLGPYVVILPASVFVSVGMRWTWAAVFANVWAGGFLFGIGWCLYRGTRNYVRARRSRDIDEPEESEPKPEPKPE